jgi:hypothetical protein
VHFGQTSFTVMVGTAITIAKDGLRDISAERKTAGNARRFGFSENQVEQRSLNRARRLNNTARTVGSCMFTCCGASATRTASPRAIDLVRVTIDRIVKLLGRAAARMAGLRHKAAEGLR